MVLITEGILNMFQHTKLLGEGRLDFYEKDGKIVKVKTSRL